MKSIDLPFRYTCQCAKALTPLVSSTKRCPPQTNDGFTWDSGESPPSFALTKKPAFSGWYMLEVHVTANQAHLDSSIYIDYQHPHLRTDTYPLRLTNGRLAKRIIYVSPSATKIRFDPAEQKVKFDIKTLRFIKLTKHFALKLMLKKLKNCNPEISEPTSLNLWKHYARFYRYQQKSETDYATWLENREPRLLKMASSLDETLSIAVVINLSDPDFLPNSLAHSLSSIEKQDYSNWALVLLVTPKTIKLKQVKELINKSPSNKTTIISLEDEHTPEISDVLSRVKSDYYIFLVAGTTLSRYALSIFSKHANTNKKALISYGDHDVLDSDGLRKEPNFKPDWNPDLLLSQNYIGENVLLKANILHEYPKQMLDAEGAWLYSILIDSVFKNHHITHIPLILSHNIKNAVNNKYSTQLKILKEKLQPYQATAEQGLSKATFKVTWPLLKPPLVSIIIPTRDGLDILKRAVNSILELTIYPSYEIIIVDNQSQELETKKYLNDLGRRPNIRILQFNKPFNYSAINNFAAKYAQGEILALLNNDVEVITPVWLLEMTSHASRTDIGCVGAMLYYPDDRIQHAGVIVGLGGCAGHSHKFYRRGDSGYSERLLTTQNYSAVTGACLVLRKSVFDSAGGFNADDLHVAFNDIDLCLRVQSLGYRNVWTPWAELYHHESISRGQDDTRKKRNRMKREVIYMKKTWLTNTIVDQHYHPRLTRIREDFSFGL